MRLKVVVVGERRDKEKKTNFKEILPHLKKTSANIGSTIPRESARQET